MKFTPEKIEEYKKKYGRIWQFTCKNDPSKSCILRQAGRNELSLADQSALTRNEEGTGSFDINKYNESILLSCWVDGDEEIKTDDALFLGIADQLRVILQKSTFEIKEL